MNYTSSILSSSSSERSTSTALGCVDSPITSSVSSAVSEPSSLFRNITKRSMCSDTCPNHQMLSTARGKSTTCLLRLLVQMKRAHNFVHAGLTQVLAAPLRRAEQKERLHMCEAQHRVGLPRFGRREELERWWKLFLVLGVVRQI